MNFEAAKESFLTTVTRASSTPNKNGEKKVVVRYKSPPVADVYVSSSSIFHLAFLGSFINLPSVSATFYFLADRPTKLFHGFQTESLPTMVLPHNRIVLGQLSSVTFSGGLLFAPKVRVSCINISYPFKN